MEVAGKIFRISSYSGREPVPLLALCDLNSQHGSGEGENDSGAFTVAPCLCAKEMTEQEDTRSR